MIIGVTSNEAQSYLYTRHKIAPIELSSLYIIAKVFHSPSMFGDVCLLVDSDEACDLAREFGTLIHMPGSLIPFSTGDMQVLNQEAWPAILDVLIARCREDILII